MKDTNAKILYIKAGDAVSEYEWIKDNQSSTVGTGPCYYVDQFLKASWKSARILSTGKSLGRNIFQGSELLVECFDGASPIKAGIKILRHIVTFKPDVILCGDVGPTLIMATLGGLLVGSKLIFSLHIAPVNNSREKSLLKKVVQLLSVGCIRRASATLCHGPYLRDQLAILGKRKGDVIEFDTGVDGGALGERKRKKEAERSILFVGRVVEDKGVFDLVDALKERLLADSSCRLIVIGSGPDSKRLEETVKGYGLGGHVDIVGAVPISEVVEYMYQAYLVVVPTQSCFPEGRCKVVKEAFYMGAPVVAPDFGPFPYIVNDGENGLLYEPDSVADLRNKIERVLDDRLLQSKLADGVKLAVKKWSRAVSSIVQLWIYRCQKC